MKDGGTDLTSCGNPFDPQVSPGYLEVRNVTVLASTSAEHSDLNDDIKYFSDWFHAKRVIALCMLFSQKMKLSLKKDSTNSVKEEDSLLLRFARLAIGS